MCHSNEFKIDERSPIIGGFRGSQESSTRCFQPTLPSDIFQWMEQRRQLATAAAAAAAAAHATGARSSTTDSERLFS